MKVSGNKVTASKGTKIAYKVKKSGKKNIVGQFVVGNNNATVNTPTMVDKSTIYNDDSTIALYTFENGFENEAIEAIDTSKSTAKTSSMYKKFGSKSLHIGVGESAVFSTDWDDLDLFAEDFTLDFWVYVAGVFGSDQKIFSLFKSLNDFENNNSIASITMQAWNLTSPTIDFKVTTGSDWQTSGEVTVNANEWNHFAICYDKAANRFVIFVNGNHAFLMGIGEANQPEVVGAKVFAMSNYDHNFYIDELRISKSVRYTSNFDVPNVSYLENVNGTQETPEQPEEPSNSKMHTGYVNPNTGDIYILKIDDWVKASVGAQLYSSVYDNEKKAYLVGSAFTTVAEVYDSGHYITYMDDKTGDLVRLNFWGCGEFESATPSSPEQPQEPTTGNYVYGSESDYFWLTEDNYEEAKYVVDSVITGTWNTTYYNPTYSDKNWAISLLKTGGFATVYYENGISKLEIFGIRSGSWNLVFEGSNDNSNYTEISTYTNTSGAHDVVITPTTSYKYIKITNNATGSTYIQGFKLASNNAETPNTPDTPEQDDNQQETWKSLLPNELADKQEEMSVNSEQIIDNMQGRQAIEGCQYKLDISGSSIIDGSIYSDDDQLGIESELIGTHEFKTKTYDIPDGSFDGTYLSTACDSQIFVPVFLKGTNINVVYQNVCWASYESHGDKFEHYISDEIHTINYVATKADETRGYCTIPLQKDMFPTEYNPKSQHIIIRGIMCSFEGPYVDDADDASSAAYTFTIKETSGKYLYYADEDGNTQSVFTGYVKSLPTGATQDTVVTIYCDQECTQVAFTTSTLTKHAVLAWNESSSTYSVKNYENNSYPDQIGGNHTGSFTQKVTAI